MKIELEKLFEEGLLRKTYPSRAKSRKSLEMAKKYLRMATENFEMNLFEVTILIAYNSMFHTARAILFRDGIKERSHYAMIKYLKEKYRVKIGIRTLNLLDSFRIVRHSVAYGFDATVKVEDAKRILEFAKKFYKIVERIVLSK